jgi:hypothetical protein
MSPNWKPWSWDEVVRTYAELAEAQTEYRSNAEAMKRLFDLLRESPDFFDVDPSLHCGTLSLGVPGVVSRVGVAPDTQTPDGLLVYFAEETERETRQATFEQALTIVGEYVARLRT